MAKKGKEIEVESEEEEETKVNHSEPATKKDSKAEEGKFNKDGDYVGKLGNGKFGKDKILVASWNVNGIRAVQKKHELEDYFKAVNPDILCINESKIDTIAFQKESASIMGMIPSEYQ